MHYSYKCVTHQFQTKVMMYYLIGPGMTRPDVASHQH